MMETRTYRRVARNRKKNTVPLSNLRPSEVVRTVVKHPRRLQELANMLDDRHRAVRDRAATIVARLSESHPGRLIRILERMKDGLGDDSAYVRWHLAYSLGRMGSGFPGQSMLFLPALIARLDDENKVVRYLACNALARLALKKPEAVKQAFESNKKCIPPPLARVLQKLSPAPTTPRAR